MGNFGSSSSVRSDPTKGLCITMDGKPEICESAVAGTITVESGYKCFTPFGSTEKICEKGLRGDPGAAGVCPSTCNFDDYVKKTELAAALNGYAKTTEVDTKLGSYAKTADLNKYFTYDPTSTSTTYNLQPKGNIVLASDMEIKQSNGTMNYFDTSPYVKYTDFGYTATSTADDKAKLPKYSTSSVGGDLWTFTGGIASKSGTGTDAITTNYVKYNDFGTGFTESVLKKLSYGITPGSTDGIIIDSVLYSNKSMGAKDNVIGGWLYSVNNKGAVNTAANPWEYLA